MLASLAQKNTGLDGTVFQSPKTRRVVFHTCLWRECGYLLLGCRLSVEVFMLLFPARSSTFRKFKIGFVPTNGGQFVRGAVLFCPFFTVQRPFLPYQRPHLNGTFGVSSLSISQSTFLVCLLICNRFFTISGFSASDMSRNLCNRSSHLCVTILLVITM